MGCSQSNVNPVAIKSIELESRPKSPKPQLLPKQQSDRIIEDCLIIWFQTDSSSQIDQEKVNLCHIVSTIKVFNDREECIAYIQKIRIEKIFLIQPADNSDFDSIRNLPQIEKIYVLNSSRGENENPSDVSISSNIFHDIDSLYQQLKTDVELCELDLLVVNTSVPPSTDAATLVLRKKQEALFLYGQLVREILYRLKFENNAKNEFIKFCRLHYTNNEEQSRLIDDFEANYRPQKALWWLTRPCFLWRILQRMQRTFEIDIFYKLGFFLKHVHTQLTIFQENNSYVSDNILIVYRGKTMFMEKFDLLLKNNENGLLSFGNFFTGHADKQIGLDFIRRRLTRFPNAVGVLFEIHINPIIRSVRSPFASLDKIHSDDNMKDNGILFSIGTVFHIDSVEECTNELDRMIWKVKLALINDDDQQLLRIVAPLRSSEVHTNPVSYVGKLFIDMNEYTQAEQFLLAMLQDGSIRSQPRRLVRVHNGLGTSYMHQGDYTRALEQFEQALNVSLTYLPPTHTDLAPLYDAIGKSYFHLNNYQKAVENYEKAADLVLHNALPGTDSLVNDLNSRLHSAKKLLNSNSS